MPLFCCRDDRCLDTQVLHEISASYRHLLDSDFTYYSTVDVSFKQVVDELLSSFNDYMENVKDMTMVRDACSCVSPSLSLSLLPFFPSPSLSLPSLSLSQNDDSEDVFNFGITLQRLSALFKYNYFVSTI